MNINGKQPSTPAPAPRAEAPAGARLFVHEAGWSVSVKRGSDRTFCHMMTPGQDYYHRLMDGELYLHREPERLCLACAARRGIISYEARRLPDEAPKFLVDSGEMPIFVLGVDDAK